jgi:hypothetical protein
VYDARGVKFLQPGVCLTLHATNCDANASNRTPAYSRFRVHLQRQPIPCRHVTPTPNRSGILDHRVRRARGTQQICVLMGVCSIGRSPTKRSMTLVCVYGKGGSRERAREHHRNGVAYQ